MTDQNDPSEVTPAELRELAARAYALGAQIDAVLVRLRAAADEPTQRSGYRLPDTAGWARHVGGELENTAGDLARIGARSSTPHE